MAALSEAQLAAAPANAYLSAMPDPAPDLARPRIGITLDSEEPGGYSKFPWYALRQNYGSAVLAAGGLPFALPHVPRAQVDAYLDQLDGLPEGTTSATRRRLAELAGEAEFDDLW